MTAEDTIRNTLNEALAVPGHIDPDPAAGALIRGAALRHRRNRRLTMASGVGAVIAVVAGVLVWTAGAHGNNSQPVPPATPAPVTSPTGSPSPSTGRSAAPSPGATSPPAGTGSSASVPPAAHTTSVTLGAATLALPAGWVAEQVTGTGSSRPILTTWCLMPDDGATSVSDSANCPILFSPVRTGEGASQVSVDTPSGLASNPEYCGVGFVGSTVTLLDYDDTQFGSRPADHRRWLYRCKDGTQWQIEQYVADNAPGFILFSEHADATVHDVMASLAATAQLPAISAPLRLSDLGIVRSVTPTTGGYRISLDRVVLRDPGWINNNPATYDYDIPAAVSQENEPTVGSLVELATNGTSVTSYVVLRPST